MKLFFIFFFTLSIFFSSLGQNSLNVYNPDGDITYKIHEEDKVFIKLKDGKEFYGNLGIFCEIYLNCMEFKELLLNFMEN